MTSLPGIGPRQAFVLKGEADERWLRVVVLLSMVSSSCASYTAVPISIPKFEAMGVRQTENSVSIGLDPFLERERQKEVFGDDLLEQGVLPIQVLVQNQGDRPIRVHATAVLVLPDGTEITQKLPVLPPSGSPPQRSQFCENALIFGGTMPGPGLLVNLGCGIFSAASGAKYQTELARWEDYSSKQLKGATLENGQWTHGFVFFEIPTERRHIRDATLLFRFTEGDPPEGSEQTLRLRLTDLCLN